jgi:hypothetical protein
MNPFRRLLGRAWQGPSDAELTGLLEGIVQPITTSATREIELAKPHFKDQVSEGRFLLLLMSVCLASILRRLKEEGRDKLSAAFRDFAVSQWHHPPSVTIASVKGFVDYVGQEVADKLLEPDADEISDFGISVLSMAILDEERFTVRAGLACGLAAYACWTEAARYADKVLGRQPAVNAKTARIGEQVFLLDYRSHYASIVGQSVPNARLAELFLFRAWTAQFGYRLVLTDQDPLSDRLIGLTVNSCKYLGQAVFQMIHDISVESELGADFIALIEDRWRQYDLPLISTRPAVDGLPTWKIISDLTTRLNIADPCVTTALAWDFLRQLEYVVQTATELGIPCPSGKPA